MRERCNHDVREWIVRPGINTIDGVSHDELGDSESYEMFQHGLFRAQGTGPVLHRAFNGGIIKMWALWFVFLYPWAIVLFTR